VYFYLHFAYGKTEAQLCQQFALAHQQCLAAQLALTLQDLSLKTSHTIHRKTAIFLIYLPAGTEIAPGGLRHLSNFIFKYLQKKKKS
jgi:hypothetical protein